VGTKATDLIANRDLNAPMYDFSQSLKTNQSTINQRRPRQQFQAMTSIFTGLNSIYNGMQLTVKRRFARNFSVQGAYTLSRAIDYISKNAQVTSINIQNPFNWRMTRGPSDNDRTHVFTGSYVWSLPSPKTVLGARWAAAVVGGWQWSGIITAASGTPFGITSTNDAVAGAGSAFAVATGSLSLDSGRSRGAKIAQWFNTTNVAQAADGTYGSLGRNVLRNPDYTNFDSRISRVVPLHFLETASLQILFESFGALNHPILGAPDNRLGRSTFGQITSVTGQRVLQLGLKLGF
jgi:hypothetical protein